jgi:hypothetical protein
MILNWLSAYLTVPANYLQEINKPTDNVMQLRPLTLALILSVYRLAKTRKINDLMGIKPEETVLVTLLKRLGAIADDTYLDETLSSSYGAVSIALKLLEREPQPLPQKEKEASTFETMTQIPPAIALRPVPEIPTEGERRIPRLTAERRAAMLREDDIQRRLGALDNPVLRNRWEPVLRLVADDNRLINDSTLCEALKIRCLSAEDVSSTRRTQAFKILEAQTPDEALKNFRLLQKVFHPDRWTEGTYKNAPEKAKSVSQFITNAKDAL